MKCPRSPFEISTNTQYESVTKFGVKVMQLMQLTKTKLLGIQENIIHLDKISTILVNVHFTYISVLTMYFICVCENIFVRKKVTETLTH